MAKALCQPNSPPSSSWRSLGSAAVLWLLLGGMSGWLYSRWGMATRDA